MAPYFLRNLVPRRDNTTNKRSFFAALRTIRPLQYAHFIVGYLAWTCDALDFFSVSLTITDLESQFGKSAHDITTSITLTLLFRSVGATIFGIISDRFGRKWPLVANLLLCCVLQLGSGFVQTFRQFLAVRSLFGIAMGGIWGLAVSNALENLPTEVRGVASGIIAEGYSAGYLLAAVINLKLVPRVAQTWRALFWTAAGVSFFTACVAAIVPESKVFLRARRLERAKGKTTGENTKQFILEAKAMIKTHWKLFIYMTLLLSGFNFLSHGSEDLYPTYLEVTKGFSSNSATIATIIGNCVRFLVGGAIAGLASQYVGRRLAIIVCLLLVGVFIPLWIIPSGFSGLAAGAFCIQFGVQGAWGVIPIFLSEISPPAFRASFPGIAYQLGNMVSAASAQIEATGGDNLKTTITQDGKTMVVQDYAKVQAIFIGCIVAYTLVLVIIGPENHGSHFDKHKTAFEEGAAADDAVFDEDAVESENGSSSAGEKDIVEYREYSADKP
ncbi:carboxylic acid transporter protein [Schizopora paradoxa]|uniref:Carboxylic acid transporter protein n=1 Tax=Schizopora paradoxa TaxID=27342 RepID=A0A0H2S3G9_9AGAM|nr:carboxylic acid transporter protein [Schizopora paradoxa]